MYFHCIRIVLLLFEISSVLTAELQTYLARRDHYLKYTWMLVSLYNIYHLVLNAQ